MNKPTRAQNTLFWGPFAWAFLHSVSFTYPKNPTKKQKDQYFDFITSLIPVLPCPACRNNLAQNLKKLNFSYDVLENQETFSKFVYDLHSMVNVEKMEYYAKYHPDIKQEVWDGSYETVKKFYTSSDY